MVVWTASSPEAAASTSNSSRWALGGISPYGNSTTILRDSACAWGASVVEALGPRIVGGGCTPTRVGQLGGCRAARWAVGTPLVDHARVVQVENGGVGGELILGAFAAARTRRARRRRDGASAKSELGLRTMRQPSCCFTLSLKAASLEEPLEVGAAAPACAPRRLVALGITPCARRGSPRRTSSGRVPGLEKGARGERRAVAPSPHRRVRGRCPRGRWAI